MSRKKKREEVVVVVPQNALSVPRPPKGRKQQQYEPELGQMMFGNVYDEFDLGEHEQYVARKLYDLSETLGKMNPEEQAHGLLGGEWGYGQDFKNDVFEMHHYYWGDCTCGAEEAEEERPHDPTCPIVLPNFRCGEIEIRWYKYIGRGMTINQKVTRKELKEIFQKCRESLTPAS